MTRCRWRPDTGGRWRSLRRTLRRGSCRSRGIWPGRLAIFGLESCGRAVNRSCFLESFGRADAIDIDGFQLGYGDGDNQGSDAVFLTKIGEDRSYYPVSTLLDGR